MQGKPRQAGVDTAVHGGTLAIREHLSKRGSDEMDSQVLAVQLLVVVLADAGDALHE